MVQKAVKDGSPSKLEVAVDNQCSVENVTRFAKNAGYVSPSIHESMGSPAS